MKKRLVVFGLGTYSELAHHYFGSGSEYEVEAFAVDAAFVTGDAFCGRPVMAWEEALRAFPCATHEMFIGIGYSRVNRLRREKYLLAKEAGYRLASYVHPTASIALNARLGDNSLVRENATIAPFVSIGDNVFIGPAVCVSHHTVIESHCYLAPAVVLCGSVHVGEACFIGANATLKDKLKIGADCVIGAGAVVLSDCEAGGIYRAESARRSEGRSSQSARL
ncbi:MAG: acetyltransferase [Methylibium sp.]|nr:acetyltransferase [Methylibium sp.]